MRLRIQCNLWGVAAASDSGSSAGDDMEEKRYFPRGRKSALRLREIETYRKQSVDNVQIIAQSIKCRN